MIFGDFLEKDITVHTVHGHSHRGVLSVIHDESDVLEFKVGFDTFYIMVPSSIYAVTVHGLQET